MGDETIPDSAEPRLESFYPPFVAGIDLPHQGVVDSYNPSLGMRQFFVTSQWASDAQLTDPIKWLDYQLELIGIYVHLNTHSK